MTAILIVDDHPLVRAALENTLRRAYADARVHEAGTLEDAERTLSERPPIDIVLLDLKIPGAEGLSGLAGLRARFPRVPVLVVSGYDDSSYQAEAHAAGAAGFVSKVAESDQMLEAVARVLAGDSYWPQAATAEVDGSEASVSSMLEALTPQQLRVLELLGQGLLNKQIAHELDIVESTVKAHVSAILRKLNVHSRTQAVLMAQKIRFHHLGTSAN
jgi:DNA-binding NarL/FixJ family response regulator